MSDKIPTKDDGSPNENRLSGLSPSGAYVLGHKEAYIAALERCARMANIEAKLWVKLNCNSQAEACDRIANDIRDLIEKEKANG